MSTKFFPLNLSKFKRVSSDKTTTTLRHDDGHEVKIAHSALSPKLRGHLASLPEHKESKRAPKVDKPMMAEGGSTEEDYDPYKDPVLSPTPKPAPTQKCNGGYMADGGEVEENEGERAEREYIQEDPAGAAQIMDPPFKKELAKGGPVGPNNPKLAESKKQPTDIRSYADGTPDAPIATPSPESAAGDPNDVTDQAVDAGQAGPTPQDPALQATSQGDLDPAVARKRQLYNTLAPVPWRIDDSGQTPHLDPMTWNRASELYDQETKAKADAEMAATSNANAENQARAAAGLPQIPVPQGSSPTQAPPTDASPMAQVQSSAPAQPQAGAQNSDPFGTQRSMDVYQQGIGEAKAGISGEAAALGQEGRAQAQALEQNAQSLQQAQQTYQDHFNTLDQERQNFQQDVMNEHIDPNHYLNSKGTLGKISTGIGLILGGIGGGLTHQQNPALQFLNDNINRDIQAQQAELGKRENLLSANMRQFGNLRDATDMTRMMQNDIVSMKLKQAAAQAADPLAKARAQQAAGNLDMSTAQIQGQMAMRRTMLQGVNNGVGNADMAAKMINFALPPEQRAAANKELQDAQNAVALRDQVLNAYDQVAKLQTLGNRVGSPIQSNSQIEKWRGAALDKLTKDTSGRVTPETVKLVGSTFAGLTDNPKSVQVGRQAINSLVSTGMHYPILESYGMNPMNWGKYNGQGESKIQFTPGLKK